MPDIERPAHAYVPGRNARHDEHAFDVFHASVQDGMDEAELSKTLAWRAGLVFLDEGYFWEAHEVLEPVWMAAPRGSATHQIVQAVIQLANAALKHNMQRPAAAKRLCELSRGHARAARSAGGECIMGLPVADIDQRIESLEAQIATDMQ